MNINPQPNGIASILRTEIEAWRRAGNISREAVAAAVIDAHAELGGEGATGVEFTFTGDTYTQAKKAAQKLFRWLDAGDTLPANMVPAILAVLPLDVRLHCLNQMFRPLGAEARSLEAVAPARFDGLPHLQAMVKEGGEAKSAVIAAIATPTPETLTAAIKELSESIEADRATKRAAEAALASAMAANQST